MNRSRLNRSRFQTQGLQLNTTNKKAWLSILIILIPIIVACIALYYVNQYIKITSTPFAYAEVIKHEYKEPELAPVSERESNIALIKRIWGKDQNIGLAIARCESGYRTLAKNNNTNGTQDQGIFQYNTVHNMPDMFNPTANITTAYLLFQRQGTTPWNSSSKCWEDKI